MANSISAVDADGHLEESHIDWRDRLPDDYKSRAPERRPSGSGQLRTIIEGKAWPRPAGLGIGVGSPCQPAPSTSSRNDRSKAAAG